MSVYDDRPQTLIAATKVIARIYCLGFGFKITKGQKRVSISKTSHNWGPKTKPNHTNLLRNIHHFGMKMLRAPTVKKTFQDVGWELGSQHKAQIFHNTSTYLPNRLDVGWEATRAQGLMNEGHVVAYLAEDISEKFQTFNYAGKAHQL
jgi:hypothetical protein